MAALGGWGDWGWNGEMGSGCGIGDGCSTTCDISLPLTRNAIGSDKDIVADTTNDKGKMKNIGLCMLFDAHMNPRPPLDIGSRRYGLVWSTPVDVGVQVTRHCGITQPQQSGVAAGMIGMGWRSMGMVGPGRAGREYRVRCLINTHVGARYLFCHNSHSAILTLYHSSSIARTA